MDHLFLDAVKNSVNEGTRVFRSKAFSEIDGFIQGNSGSFPGDFITPYLLGGASIGFLLDLDTNLTIDNVTVNGKDFTGFIPSELLEQELKNDSIDFGLSIGAGLSFSIGVIDMVFQAQYNLGLTDLNDEAPQEGVEQDEIKNRGFQVTGGVLFSL